MKTKTDVKTNLEHEVSIRDKAIALSKDLYEKYFDVSIILSDIYHSEVWKTWGFNTINDYMENELLIGYRTGMYHVQMGDAIKKLKLTKATLKGIGWSKFKEAIKLINDDSTAEDVKATLNEIKNMTTEEVENFVKIKRKKADTVTEKVTMKFTFLTDQAIAIEKAIAIASELLTGGKTDAISQSRCLEFICLEFQANYNPELAEHIQSLMSVEQEPAKAEYKERVDKGKKRKKTEEGALDE